VGDRLSKPPRRLPVWKSNFIYHEIADGDHDSALWVDIDLETLQIRE